MKVLDLYCGGGGAAMGYAELGWIVEGVDIEYQPAYPFKQYTADAIEFLLENGPFYDFIHASPPCQGYSHAVSTGSKYYSPMGKNTPRLIVPTREALEEIGVPWVIENVIGARSEMDGAVTLCGAMFNAHPQRHRLFQCSWPQKQPRHPSCHGLDKRWAKENGYDPRQIPVAGHSGEVGMFDVWQDMMEMWWPGLRWHDLVEAIPPRYTRWIGKAYAEHAGDPDLVRITTIDDVRMLR